MSFAQGFAMPAGFAHGNGFHQQSCDPQPLTEEEDEAKSLNGTRLNEKEEEEEDCDSDASSDSMASCPLRGPSRYERTFKTVVHGVFNTQTGGGMNHADFVRRVNELRSAGVVHEVDDDSLFLHVICNQYATACKLESGKQWEAWAEMRSHYTDGTLPRYIPPETTRSNKKAKIWQFETVEAEAYTTRVFLDTHGLGTHQLLHERMEAAAVASMRARGAAEPVVLPGHQQLGFAVHAFKPTDKAAFDALLPAVMKEQLREDAGRPPTAVVVRGQPSVQQSHSMARPPASRPGVSSSSGVSTVSSNRYVPTEEDLEADMDQDEKVTWGGAVLCKIDVQGAIERSVHQAKILSGLDRSFTVEDAVSKIAMKCGATYLRKPSVYRPQPQQNEEGRRVYTRAMLPAMFVCASEVMETYVYRYEKK